MLDNVQCFGDEKSLLDCQSAPWGTHDCDVREAAGVFCGEYNHVLSAGCKGYTVRGCMGACGMCKCGICASLQWRIQVFLRGVNSQGEAPTC